MSEAGPILIVEDDADIRQVMRMFLESRGFEVREAQNGTEALDAIARERPVLMLLDLMMPVMNGSELLERMHAIPDLASIPVLLVTAWAGRAASVPGVAGVVSKPVDIRDLSAQIEHQMSMRA